VQAEYVRVPHADGSLHALPPGGLSDADACMFSDVFPTAYECAAASQNFWISRHELLQSCPLHQNKCSPYCQALSRY